MASGRRVSMKAKITSPRESMSARWCGSRHRRWQGLGIKDSGPFHDRINTVSTNVLERFDRAVRPANLDGFHFLRRAEPKVEAQIALREITSSTADFTELLDARRANGYAKSAVEEVISRKAICTST